jgi:hypothetical protein
MDIRQQTLGFPDLGKQLLLHIHNQKISGIGG